MPSQPFWFARLNTILAEVRVLDAEYLDRGAVGRIFGVGERRARQLMVGLERMKVGNAVAIRRTSLLERLETASVGVSKFPGVMNARGSDPDASSATQKLPPGIQLTGGELRVSFTTATELATKLLAVSAAITADSNAFDAATRIIPQPSHPAQQNSTSTHGKRGNPDVDSRAVDSLTRAHDAETNAPCRGSLNDRYYDFCTTKVKDHLRALPQAIRSQWFDETRSAIRRAVPQLRQNELDEMTQRELESKIRARLHLPSLEEFTAG